MFWLHKRFVLDWSSTNQRVPFFVLFIYIYFSQKIFLSFLLSRIKKDKEEVIEGVNNKYPLINLSLFSYELDDRENEDKQERWKATQTKRSTSAAHNEEKKKKGGLLENASFIRFESRYERIMGDTRVAFE